MFRRHVFLDQGGQYQTIAFEPLDRECIEYEEARARMARMLGNFSYDFNSTTLRAFMEELANYFNHENRATEVEFIGAAMMAWRYGDKDPPPYDPVR